MTEAILQLITPGEISRKLGQSLAHAFQDAPDYRYILSDHPDRIEALNWLFGTFMMRLAFRCGYVHATVNGSAGMLALAPGQCSTLRALLAAGVLSFPAQVGWKASWRALMLGLSLERRRLKLTREPHWYLLAIGVEPGRQGQGIGYNLMSQAIRRAEVDGLPCYLEVFDEALVRHCESRGFVVVQQELLPTGFPLWSMMRQPSTVSAPDSRALIYF